MLKYGISILLNQFIFEQWRLQIHYFIFRERPSLPILPRYTRRKDHVSLV